MKATIETTLLLHANKHRDACISFSKLSKNQSDYFIMIIDFNGKGSLINEEVRSFYAGVENCFKKIIQPLIRGY